MKCICPVYKTCTHKNDCHISSSHCTPHHDLDDGCQRPCFGNVVCITIPELRKRKIQELSKPK